MSSQTGINKRKISLEVIHEQYNWQTYNYVCLICFNQCLFLSTTDYFLMIGMNGVYSTPKSVWLTQTCNNMNI